jgi:hypothetical protein
MRFLCLPILIPVCLGFAQQTQTPVFPPKLFGMTVAGPATRSAEGFAIRGAEGLTIHSSEGFAIQYTGKFYAAESGRYYFRIHSNVVSKLYIDGKLLIDLDGPRTVEDTRSAVLSSNMHGIRMDYIQGPSERLELILEVQTPTAGTFHIFHTDNFLPPGTSTPAIPSSTPPLPLAEEKSAIELAAQKAMAYISHLPDFLCTEVVDRTENRSGPGSKNSANGGWQHRDVLTILLTYSKHAEDYRLTAVDNRPTQATYESVGGAVSGGEFGSLISEIFQPHAAHFDWDRLDKIRDRTVLVFRYSIQQEKSQYSIQYPVSRTETKRIVVGHHGLVFILPDDGSVLRVVRIADLPTDSPVRDASTTLDYALTDVGGQSHLLPLFAEIELSTSSIQTHNHVSFLNYASFPKDGSSSH